MSAKQLILLSLDASLRPQTPHLWNALAPTLTHLRRSGSTVIALSALSAAQFAYELGDTLDGVIASLGFEVREPTLALETSTGLTADEADHLDQLWHVLHLNDIPAEHHVVGALVHHQPGWVPQRELTPFTAYRCPISERTTFLSVVKTHRVDAAKQVLQYRHPLSVTYVGDSLSDYEVFQFLKQRPGTRTIGIGRSSAGIRVADLLSAGALLDEGAVAGV